MTESGFHAQPPSRHKLSPSQIFQGLGKRIAALSAPVFPKPIVTIPSRNDDLAEIESVRLSPMRNMTPSNEQAARLTFRLLPFASAFAPSSKKTMFFRDLDYTTRHEKHFAHPPQSSLRQQSFLYQTTNCRIFSFLSPPRGHKLQRHRFIRRKW